MSALVGLAVLGLGIQSVSANTSTVTIGSTGTEQHAEADFTFAPGQMTIVITNLFKDSEESNYSITAAIRGLSFTISQTGALGSVTSFTANGNLINVGDSGSYASATANTNLTATNPVFTQAGDGWTYSGSPSKVGIGSTGNPVTGNNPLILGAPNGSDLYANAGNSIAGNDPHNPLVKQSATFVFNITGLSADATLSTTAGATFYFGTGTLSGAGTITNNPPGGGSGQTPPTPLPASVWAGGALIGGLAVVRKFRRKSV